VRQGMGGWLLAIILSVLSSLVIGLSLVWLNIERMDMAYNLRRMQGELEDRQSLKAKLEVERDRLLSPYELGRKAVALGMRDARQGQIRRLGDGGL